MKLKRPDEPWYRKPANYWGPLPVNAAGYVAAGTLVLIAIVVGSFIGGSSSVWALLIAYGGAYSLLAWYTGESTDDK